jgi:hypothetical protein
MPDYILRNVDDSLWKRFKQRAKAEGHQLRWVLLELVQRYVKNGLN